MAAITLRLTTAVLTLGLSVSAAWAEDWSTEGPVGKGADSYCVAISPEGLGVRLTPDQGKYDLALFKLKASELALAPLSPGERNITTLMDVDRGYTAIRHGTVVISEDTESATIYATSADFHLYDALKKGSTLSIKAGQDVAFPSLDFDKNPFTPLIYSLAGAAKALTWAEACIASARG